MSAPRPPRPLARPALLLGAALLMPLSAADAQLGRLMKRAAAAAAEAAVDEKVGEKVGDRTGAAGRPADASRLEITPERIDAFVAGMEGPLAAARAAAAREARRRDAEARAEAYTACRKKTEAELGAALFDTSPEAMDRAARIGNEMSAMGQRHNAAEQAGDRRQAAVLMDSLAILGAALEDAQAPAFAQRCGAKPVAPAEPTPGDRDAMLRPAVPAGMTPVQFGVMRERVAAWLVASGVGAALSPAESAALESRREALAPLAPFFQDRSLPWTNVLGGLEPTP